MKRIRCFKYFFILLLCVVTINQYEVKVFSIDQSMRVVDNENMIFDGTQKTAENNSRNLDSISNLINLNQGSLTVRFKLDEKILERTEKLVSLLSISNKKAEQEYATFYINPQEGKAGIEIKGKVNKALGGVTVKDTRWHTITYLFDGQNMVIYCDSQKIGAVEMSGLFDGVQWLERANSILIGGIERKYDGKDAFMWSMIGEINQIYLSKEVLSQSDINEEHIFTNVQGIEQKELYSANEEGVFLYRIPSLVKTKSGALLAAADARKMHYNDWGDIATVVKRSTDNGNTWSNNVTVVDTATEPTYSKTLVGGGEGSDTRSSLTIDPVLLSTSAGKVFLLVNFMPESTGSYFNWGGNNKGQLGGAYNSLIGTGYVNIDGKKYLKLNDSQGKLYTVRDNGLVYNDSNELTAYKVSEGSRKFNYADKGDLYENGKRLGNIYLNSTETGNDSAPLKAFITNYLWLFTSDDDGLTWSEPVDITPQVKEEWMKFIGPGPGVGIEINVKEDGVNKKRIMFPIYYTNSSSSSGIGKQSSANIYSDDGGVTWHRSESPNDGRLYGNNQHASSKTVSNEVSDISESQIIQLNNGHLLQFMRHNDTTTPGYEVLISRSEDYGLTWSDELTKSGIHDTDCQVSVLHTNINNKEYVLLLNASYSGRGASNRKNGVLRIGEVQQDDSIKWIASKTVEPKKFAYSSMTEITSDTVAIIFENSGGIQYGTVNIEEIIRNENEYGTPGIMSVKVDNEKVSDTIEIKLKMTEKVIINGEKKLELTIGNEKKYAEYVSGNQSDTLVFSYRIEETDKGELKTSGVLVNTQCENVYGNRLVIKGKTYSLVRTESSKYKKDEADVQKNTRKMEQNKSHNGFFVPKTGDDIDFSMLCVCLTISFGSIILFKKNRKKRKG